MPIYRKNAKKWQKVHFFVYLCGRKQEYLIYI